MNKNVYCGAFCLSSILRGFGLWGVWFMVNGSQFDGLYGFRFYRVYMVYGWNYVALNTNHVHKAWALSQPFWAVLKFRYNHERITNCKTQRIIFRTRIYYLKRTHLYCHKIQANRLDWKVLKRKACNTWQFFYHLATYPKANCNFILENCSFRNFGKWYHLLQFYVSPNVLIT